jgi:hypothetical protein
MKVNLDVDCTPQEARAFFGLPDLTPVHTAFIERMMGMVREGLSASDMERMFRGWYPMMEGGLDAWTKAMSAMVGGKTDGPPSR